ncbi:energy-coupling factor ABC transporter ATP-binding protein [Herbiconiux sp. P17]|uniref:energy-coupling factor ABC transporter ATP-binding protein n=1 Tax=Herbiconiux wuyangfengii TaxID=3342794 RepID=UPI0035B848B7
MVLASLRDVTFSYEYSEAPALQNVSLELEEGKLYGVVGLNASGKTTLCSVLRGIIPHFHKGELTGSVEILGTDLDAWNPGDLSVRIGYVFQNPFTQISGVKETVFEEVALGLENLGLARDDMIDRVGSVLDRLGLWGIAEKNPNGLSGGQRQKVAFASIVAMDADVLVIDEPTSQLDPESSDEVFQIIRQLKDDGKSIVLVEHKIDLLAEYADRLIVMQEGRIAAEGDIRSVLTSPVLGEAYVAPPDVTELALRLQAEGRPLARLPITREEALPLVAARLEGARRAH